jgi:hypothetical protein
LNPVLGSTFLNGTDTLTSFNPINETFTQISYAGERSIHPPNNISHLTINATERGNLSMIHQPGGVTIVYGQSLLTTKDNNNNTMDIFKKSFFIQVRTNRFTCLRNYGNILSNKAICQFNEKTDEFFF